MQEQEFNAPCLCIPLVSKYIKELQIRKIMDEINLGVIDKIDIISVKTRNKQPQYQSTQPKQMNRVFIHYKTWGTGANAIKARELLLKGKEIKIFHNELWFWKISLCREKEKVNVNNNDNNNSNNNNNNKGVTLIQNYLEKRKQINNVNYVANRYMFFETESDIYENNDEEDEEYNTHDNTNYENYYVEVSNIPDKK